LTQLFKGLGRDVFVEGESIGEGEVGVGFRRTRLRFVIVGWFSEDSGTRRVIGLRLLGWRAPEP